MGVPILVLGETGSGKTYSIHGFNENEVGIFSVEKGRLPFRDKHFKVLKNATYEDIRKVMKKSPLKRFVIDDSQYLMVGQMFDGMMSGDQYKLFKTIAKDFRDLVHFVNAELPDDVTVYFLHHTQETASGRIKAKTVGKMLDDVLTVEGCFDVVIQAIATKDGNVFMVHNDGNNSVKTPKDMFGTDDDRYMTMPNDLKMVDDCVRAYWGLDDTAEVNTNA